MIKDEDMIGHRFNKLIPVERVEDQVTASTGRHHPMYNCLCDCGNYKVVRGSNLIHGAVKSCGCIRSDSQRIRAKQRTSDIIGNKYNRLTVLEWLGANHNAQSKYRCVCDCGRITEVYRSSLISGDTKSCGCYSREVAAQTAMLTGYKNAANLIGYKTGKLTVLDKVGSVNQNVIWRVQCDCGAVIELSSARLLSGGVASCGCLISKGEEKIANYLSDRNVEFEKQKTFAGCKDKNPLPFDFWIPSLNLLIEFDGEQHYKDNAFFHHSLSYVQSHDKIKDEYCRENNINLIRIPYTQLNNIDEYLNSV